MQYGFFSKKAVNMGSHTSVYELDADGRPCGEAEVCCVYDDQVGAEYRWDDKQCVGRVGNWLRDGRAGLSKWIPADMEASTRRALYEEDEG